MNSDYASLCDRLRCDGREMRFEHFRPGTMRKPGIAGTLPIMAADLAQLPVGSVLTFGLRTYAKADYALRRETDSCSLWLAPTREESNLGYRFKPGALYAADAFLGPFYGGLVTTEKTLFLPLFSYGAHQFFGRQFGITLQIPTDVFIDTPTNLRVALPDGLETHQSIIEKG